MLLKLHKAKSDAFLSFLSFYALLKEHNIDKKAKTKVLHYFLHGVLF